MNGLQLTGRDRGHLEAQAEPRCLLHAAAVEPFLAMCAAAARAGFDLVPVSSFRDFERQRSIWNAKFRGERPALDRRGRPVRMNKLDPGERIETILCWSALPGASRHHWGTDVDIADGRVAGYRPRLEADEYRRGGPFAALSGWLSAHMRRYGFYRPYASRRPGVQPEPWHLSYAPVARGALAALTTELLASAIRDNGVDGEAEILARLPAIRKRYVLDVDAPPRMRSRHAMLNPR
ncbi:MAG TPA: M15 family metallopeptidase [Steroidobacteraceae bacterium]|nr:M15 family metallopeptidase [Steroidobacteraceae bacterium]